MKRFLHLFHRWTGIVLCGFFALWFFSGIFMMYVEFPQLTWSERIAASPALDFSTAKLSPAEAAARLHAGDFSLRGTPSRNHVLLITDPAAKVRPESARLAQILGRPAYVFTYGVAQPVVVFADDGTHLAPVTVEQARQAVIAFAPGKTPRFLDTMQSDQWAVSAALNPHRPLHRFALDDAEHTELYVSTRTGEVVRDSTRRERGLNYFAAVTHWLYPHIIRQFPDAWAWMIDVLAASGTVLSISGLWVGVLRARRRMPKMKSTQQRLIRWHYWTGGIFGVLALTWVFSGWMSMNPGGVNPSRSASSVQALVYSGKPFAVADFATIPRLPTNAVEAELMNYDGQNLFLVTSRQGERTLVSASPGLSVRTPSIEGIIARAASLLPEAKLVEAKVLTEYDNYYYSRHPERGGNPLPAVRIRFSDAKNTWFHIDPTTGAILSKSTSANRLFRHLYNGLHSFDWWWLWSRRPLWDIVVITFSLGGLSLSVLGVVIGVRRVFGWAAKASSRQKPNSTEHGAAPRLFPVN